MLIRFTVENFRSVKDEITLDLVPSADTRHSTHIVNFDDLNLRTLKAGVIYGANASGKSNLVSALQFAKELILRGVQPKQGIRVERFKLSPDCLTKPTKFEFDIVQDKTHFSYGIVLNEKYILEEWLFAKKPGGREVQYFERKTSKDGTVQIEFGAQLRSESHIEFVGQGTRPEQPFLTEAEQRNVKQVGPVMEWFRNTLLIIGSSVTNKFVPLHMKKDDDFTKRLGKFLKSVGTGIESIDVEESDLDFERDLPDLPSPLKENILSDLSKPGTAILLHSLATNEIAVISGSTDKPKLKKMITLHKSSDGKEVKFHLKDESEGTRRMIDLSPVLFQMQNKVIVIDELDRSLHPLLSQEYVRLFLQQPNNSQLLVTTHEESLLDLELVRRDEIWFIEKDEKQASRLYPLTEFKVRPDLEIRKGYLSGRFGAVPIFTGTDKLLANSR